MSSATAASTGAAPAVVGAPPQPPAKPLFSYRKYWAQRFGIAPFLPMTRAEMDALGWDSCDIIIVTGDAYVDHPSFGMAIIGRLLEAQGFRVGIIAQPDWQSAEPFKALGGRGCSSASPAATWIRWSTATRRTAACATTTPTRRAARAASGPTARVDRLRAALPRGLSRTCRSCSAASRPRCAASRITTTGRTRCAARSWSTPRPTSCSTATPSAPSSRSRIGSPPARSAVAEIDDIRGVALYASARARGLHRAARRRHRQRRRRRAA